VTVGIESAIVDCTRGAPVLLRPGSGTIVDPFQPTRVLSVGDSFSDLGQDGKRYTVNDDTINIWSQQLAAELRVAPGGVEQGRSFLCPR
jgi:hypothetical protein